MRITITCIAAALSLMIACQEPAANKNAAASPAPGGDTAAAKAIAANTPVAKPDSTVLEGEWFLQPALPSDTAAGKTPTLKIDLKKSHFTGNTGCNNMNGKFWFSATDSSLSFSEKLVTTKMLCTGYNEKAFIKSLLLTSHYRMRDGILTFLADDNSELSHWAKKPATTKPLKA